MIKNYLSTLNSSSWVLNTKYGFNCNNMHELKKSRRLNISKVDLWVGNGARVVALIVRTYYFTFPNGLIL
jgi:hypothetical protein